MDVTVEEYVGRSMLDPNRRVVRAGNKVMFRVRVDGKHAGFIQNRPGARLLMHTRFTLEEMKEIESEVARQVGELGGAYRDEVQSVVPKEVPEEINPEDEGLSDDEVDIWLPT